jgi:large subunit ribosomal protein L34
MLCLRCSRGLGATTLTSSLLPRIARNSTPVFKASSKRYVSRHLLAQSPSSNTVYRTFTSFLMPSRRPTIFPLRTSPSLPTNVIVGEEALDLQPKISTHPALGSIQVRCGPRNTFNPSHFVRKRRHGFLSRIRTRKGRATLKRRRAKGRSTLSH